MTPRGIRNHNPGNLIDLGIDWDGIALTSERTPEQIHESKFCVFRAPWWGLRAMAKVLVRYHGHYGLKTVAGMVAKYAPGHENPTDAYSAAVATALRVAVNAPIEMNFRTLEAMMKCMVRFENGLCPYTWELAAGIILAGVEPDAPSVLDGGSLIYK